MLAELGAEVIKVEDPSGGDPMRQLPPILNGRGLYDLLLNRGKKSMALDLKRADSVAVLDRLIAKADVVVESFRPRTARRLGVSGEQLRARHPRIVHCAITGYGQTGPYAERPGTTSTMWRCRVCCRPTPGSQANCRACSWRTWAAAP
jgi:CoA:oxalate CoA-transferase